VIGRPSENLVDLFPADRLRHVPDRSETHILRAVLLDRDDVHRDVAERNILFERVEYGPAVHAWQLDVEHDAVRAMLTCERQPVFACSRHDAFESTLADVPRENLRESRVILHDQDDVIVFLHDVAVIRDHGQRRSGWWRCEHRRTRYAWRRRRQRHRA